MGFWSIEMKKLVLRLAYKIKYNIILFLKAQMIGSTKNVAFFLKAPRLKITLIYQISTRNEESGY
jgi:hypothetical protein